MTARIRETRIFIRETTTIEGFATTLFDRDLDWRILNHNARTATGDPRQNQRPNTKRTSEKQMRCASARSIALHE
jgi:hypothetical protein